MHFFLPHTTGGCNNCQGSTIYQQIGQCQFPNGTCSMYTNGTFEAPECPVGSQPCSGGNFSLVSPEPFDPQYYQQLVALRNNGQKILLSVGGWNFPSSVFSYMVSTMQTRAMFIQSAQQYMEQYGFDGIDVSLWGRGEG